MKKILLIIGFVQFLTIISFGQKEVVNEINSFEEFMSENGVIIKFIENPLPDIKTTYGYAICNVRKLEKKGTIEYYLTITKNTTYNTRMHAYISYNDLKEMKKAFDVLKIEKAKYDTLQPNYMEEKYLTTDGVILGFYINSKGKSLWYMRLERYGKENKIYIKETTELDKLFKGSIEMIEEWQKHTN